VKVWAEEKPEKNNVSGIDIIERNMDK